MPSNVFANTGTNVSVLFFDKSHTSDKVILIDASKLGEEYQEEIDDFSVAVTYDEIKEKKYSLSAGQYFDVKIEYVELTQDEFNAQMNEYTENLKSLFAEGNQLQTDIIEQLAKVKYE